MSYAIVMPQLGLTMTEGAVSEWLKKPGDPVQKNEAVFIVSTEKVDMEVESAVEGTMGEILVQTGQTVPVGTTLAYLEGVEGEVESVPVEPSSPVNHSVSVSVADTTPVSSLPIAESPESALKKPERVQSSPRAKRLAAELGVNLSTLQGTSDGGRISEEDVRRAASLVVQGTESNKSWRHLIAERISRSIQTIAVLTLSAEANAERLLTLRRDLQPPANGNSTKLAVTDLLLAIFASALQASPDLRISWEKDRPRPHASVDIGLAVSSAHGFVAPVIKNVAELTLSQLLHKRQELMERGREGNLSLSELEGGVATLSNLGMYRVDQFQSNIGPGQSLLLAVGSIRIRPWVEAALVTKPTVILNLTVDRRVADEESAAIFLNKLIGSIEDPSRLEWQTGYEPAIVAGQGQHA